MVREEALDGDKSPERINFLEMEITEKAPVPDIPNVHMVHLALVFRDGLDVAL